jgi:hypothetical protein
MFLLLIIIRGESNSKGIDLRLLMDDLRSIKIHTLQIDNLHSLINEKRYCFSNISSSEE